MDILIACEFSGIVRDAFRAVGHNAVSCDMIESEQVGPHYNGDVRDILDHGWDMMIAFPPCTYLAGSGARWWAGRQAEQLEALEFVRTLLNAPIGKICLENPVGKISTSISKPDQIVQPWQFGHGETKKTCLWLKGLQLLQSTNIVKGRVQRIWREAPSPDRWKNRSRTYTGIAKAMADQWGRI